MASVPALKIAILSLFATSMCSQVVAQEQAAETIASHVRIQGYSCAKAISATRDAAASRPDSPVWLLVCDGATYRVRLVPDMAARIEVVN